MQIYAGLRQEKRSAGGTEEKGLRLPHQRDGMQEDLHSEAEKHQFFPHIVFHFLKSRKYDLHEWSTMPGSVALGPDSKESIVGMHYQGGDRVL